MCEKIITCMTSVSASVVRYGLMCLKLDTYSETISLTQRVYEWNQMDPYNLGPFGSVCTLSEGLNYH